MTAATPASPATPAAAAAASPTADATADATPPTDGACLHVRHGALRRGGRVVLQPGALAIPLGAVVGLVGANGAGKSTLLLALAGLLRASGAAFHATLGDAVPRSVGLVPQQPAWPPWLRVRDATALLGVDAARLAADEPALALAPLLDRGVRTLSAGQSQLLAMACALVRDDPLLLLDEPFAAVDLARRRALRDLLHRARARRPRLVTILSSHAAAELLATCDWLVALDRGRYVHAGPLDAFLAAAHIPRDAPDAVPRFEQRLAELTA